MNQTRQWLKAHVSHFVLLLFVLQPVLDVISFWLQELGMSNLISLGLRLAFLGVCALSAFLLSERKGVYWAFAGVLVLLCAGHIIACRQAGAYSPFADLTNYIRVILMPVTTLCLITFLKADEKAFDSMQKGLTAALFIMFAVEILATILGTDHHTYMDGSGIIGWFSNTNSQSNNLCVLLAISLGWQLSHENRNQPLFILTLILGFAALFFFCTRLAYLGIGVICAGFALSLVLIRLRNWKTALLFAGIGVLFLALLPVSPMMNHIGTDTRWEEWKQDVIESNIGSKEELKEVLEMAEQENNNEAPVPSDPTAPALTEEELEELARQRHQRLVEKLTPIYETYVPDFVSLFGAEKTMEMFHYSVDIRDFVAMRAKKIMFSQLLMNDSPISARFFGLDLNRFTVGEHNYDVENDFHGIYFLQGGVGLVLLIAFILYFVYLVFWALIKNAKRYFTTEAAGYGMALLLCLAHCYNTAGVLRRPNASVYLSAILAAIYYLVRVKVYRDERN